MKAQVGDTWGDEADERSPVLLLLCQTTLGAFQSRYPQTPVSDVRPVTADVVWVAAWACCHLYSLRSSPLIDVASYHAVTSLRSLALNKMKTCES